MRGQDLSLHMTTTYLASISYHLQSPSHSGDEIFVVNVQKLGLGKTVLNSFCPPTSVTVRYRTPVGLIPSL